MDKNGVQFGPIFVSAYGAFAFSDMPFLSDWKHIEFGTLDGISLTWGNSLLHGMDGMAFVEARDMVLTPSSKLAQVVVRV
jgi:hypothetical protein